MGKGFDFNSRVKNTETLENNGLSDIEYDFFTRINRAYDVFLNCSDLDTDNMIVNIFSHAVQSMSNRERLVTLGYGITYVKTHRNSPYPDKQKLTLTFSDWCGRIEKRLKEEEDK